MADERPHVSVCVCTFKRPAMLRPLLAALAMQRTDDLFTYSIVIVDNDATGSAAAIVTEEARQLPLTIVYGLEPVQNIAMARNRALSLATGDYFAFIDDDEVPTPNWLLLMLQTCVRFEAAGVLGPVRPRFVEPPPDWVIKGGFCERPEHFTGQVMAWNSCRTGNVLCRTAIVAQRAEPFDPRFGTGGEDMDFFRRLTAEGFTFVWCHEAVVDEWVPPDRVTRVFMLKRALLRGRNILRHPRGTWRYLAVSLLAVPVYLGILPFALAGGQHRFMTYAIKLCDHAGRLLAAVRLNPVHERS